MIIVSGYLLVDAADRDAYIAACLPVIEAARRAEGCIDFALSPDPLDAARVNVYEAWVGEEQVTAFRELGPDDELGSMIRGAVIEQHEIAFSAPL